MLYVGTRAGLPEQQAPALAVEPVEESRKAVVRWFTQPVIQYIGSHSGCSCGFPSIVAEEVVAYYEGMLPPPEERADDLRSVSALIALLRATQSGADIIELFPVWNGDEGVAPKGVITWALDDLVPETFFFTEQFMHVIQASAPERS